ncbi:MAG: methyltransferase [Mycobacteriales bacterium]
MSFSCYPAWSRFSTTLAKGVAANAVEYGPAEQQVMLAGIEAILAGPTQALAATVDFSGRARLLDVGCGTGSWALAVLERNPEMRATLVDVPAATGVTQARVAESGLADRVAVVSADALTDVLPEGHDVVMVNNLVHYFAAENACRLLSRVADVTDAGTLLLLADFWTDATHTEPVAAALMAGEFAAQVEEVDVYSVDEIRGWLAGTGWTFVAHQPLAGPQSLVVAERR